MEHRLSIDTDGIQAAYTEDLPVLLNHYGSIERINLCQASAFPVIGSTDDGGIGACGQVKHQCRFRRVRRGEPIPLDEGSVSVFLPIIVGRNDRSVGVVNCHDRVAQRVAYPKGR